MALRVTTNNHERPLLAWEELPESERDDFDYVTGEDRLSPRFVKYRESWWDTSDTEGMAPDSLRALGWDTYLTTSFFDGLVFRWFDREGDLLEGVVVGHYYDASDI